MPYLINTRGRPILIDEDRVGPLLKDSHYRYLDPMELVGGKPRASYYPQYDQTAAKYIRPYVTGTDKNLLTVEII